MNTDTPTRRPPSLICLTCGLPAHVCDCPGCPYCRGWPCVCDDFWQEDFGEEVGEREAGRCFVDPPEEYPY